MAIAESLQQVEIVLKTKQRASIKTNSLSGGWCGLLHDPEAGAPLGFESYTKYFYAIEKPPFFHNLLQNKKSSDYTVYYLQNFNVI